MKYPDASQMRYPDASKAWDPKARRVLEARPAQSRAAAPSAAPAGRASIAAAAIFAPAAAAQSGNLPPPAAAAAAAGDSPLQVPQAAMAIGDPIPVIWGRRRGNVGGVLAFPRATEARFENTSTTVTSRYHMVIGEGRIPDIQRRDVRCGECRNGTFSQNESARAGSWAPGNFATAASFSWTPTNFTGGGGNYQGLSTFEAGATFPGGSDDWRTAWNVFLRGGTIVERGRLLDSTVDSSDNVADLALWALQRSGRVPNGMIDFPSLVAAARFAEVNGLWCNGEFSGSTNLGDWLVGILPQFLLRETKVAGRFGLRPLVPTNSDGTIKTTAITPRWVLTEAAIKPGSYQIEYTDTATSRPTPLTMLWRQQHDDTDVPIVRTLVIGDPNAPGPPEQHDLSQFATSENHAAKVGAYKFTRRTLSTHTASVVLKPGNQTGTLVEGDVVQIYLQVISSREPAGVANRFYVVESIGHNLAGEETLSLSHFPVNSSGQSLIALAVAAAAGTGTILPSNRTGSSCDLPGAASDTSVPARSTSGTPFSASSGGGGISGGSGGGGGVTPGFNPYGPDGAPTDSPPLPNEDGASRRANSGSQIPGKKGSDTLCPDGFNGYVAGAVAFNRNREGGYNAHLLGQSYFSYLATAPASITRTGHSFAFQEHDGSGAFTNLIRAERYRVSWLGWPPYPTYGGIPLGPELGPPSFQSQERWNVWDDTTNPGEPEITSTVSYTCNLPSGQPDTPITNQRYYTVVEGDTLGIISQKMYGTTARANDILTANQVYGNSLLYGFTLSGANWLMWPGMVLAIPA